jgi:hypothetical protein
MGQAHGSAAPAGSVPIRAAVCMRLAIMDSGKIRVLSRRFRRLPGENALL